MLKVLQDVVLAIGSGGLLVLAVAWLARTLVKQSLSRDLEKFKAVLSSHDLSVERLKHELQIVANERAVVVAKLHEKRAEVVAQTYSLLVDTQSACADLAAPFDWSGAPSKGEKYKAAFSAARDFYVYFDKHKIYLPPEACTKIESFVEGMREKAIGFGIYVDGSPWNQGAVKEKHEAWDAAWKHMKDEVPAAREALENELRSLIGVLPSARSAG